MVFLGTENQEKDSIRIRPEKQAAEAGGL